MGWQRWFYPVVLRNPCALSLAVYLFCEISASRWLQALLSHSHHGLDLILRGFILFFFLMIPPPSEEIGWKFRIGNGAQWRHRDDGDGVKPKSCSQKELDVLPSGIPCPEPARRNLWVVFAGRYPRIMRREKASVPVDAHRGCISRFRVNYTIVHL